MTSDLACPVCGVAAPGLDALAEHLVVAAESSDGPHVMWLNRKVTKHRVTARDLRQPLAQALSGSGSTAERVER